MCFFPQNVCFHIIQTTLLSNTIDHIHPIVVFFSPHITPKLFSSHPIITLSATLSSLSLLTSVLYKTNPIFHFNLVHVVVRIRQYFTKQTLFSTSTCMQGACCGANMPVLYKTNPNFHFNLYPRCLLWCKIHPKENGSITLEGQF